MNMYIICHFGLTNIIQCIYPSLPNLPCYLKVGLSPVRWNLTLKFSPLGISKNGIVSSPKKSTIFFHSFISVIRNWYFVTLLGLLTIHFFIIIPNAPNIISLKQFTNMIVFILLKINRLTTQEKEIKIVVTFLAQYCIIGCQLMGV